MKDYFAGDAKTHLTGMLGGFIYLGGMHGYNVSNWLVSQVGVPGLWMKGSIP